MDAANLIWILDRRPGPEFDPSWIMFGSEEDDGTQPAADLTSCFLHHYKKKLLITVTLTMYSCIVSLNISKCQWKS